MSKGRDYRVKIDYAYIPKNAYEDKLFFEIVLLCKNVQTPPLLRDLLLTKNSSGKDFWEERNRKTGSSTIEVIRDILDFACYCGMLIKWFPFGKESHIAHYKITNFGQDICNDFIKKEEKVRIGVIKALMEYKIGNSQINITQYNEFTNFRVRPFFLLLKILYLFEQKWGNKGVQFEPYPFSKSSFLEHFPFFISLC